MSVFRSTVLAVFLALPAPASFAAMKDIPHPFILWTREEAVALRKRIESDPEAKEQYDRWVSGPAAVGPFINIFKYLAYDDKKAGEAEIASLLKFIGQVPEPMTEAFKENAKKHSWTTGGPSHNDRHMRDEQSMQAIRYDAFYDELTPEQRAGLEKSFRAYIEFHVGGHKPWHPAFKYDRTSWLPNMHWPRTIGTHLIAAAIRDEKAVADMFNSTGGFKWFFDEYVTDGRYYNEEFCKYVSNIGTLIFYANSVERLGLGRYGWDYVGKNGGSLRRFLEMPIYVAFPREEAPPGENRFPGVTMGDAHELYIVLSNSGKPAWWTSAPMLGPFPKMLAPGWYELGYKRFPDSGFAYFAFQFRRPTDEKYFPSFYFGLKPIAAADVTPPPAPSQVNRERGFALLRAEESPAYWEGPKPAVALQFGKYYVHYVHDCFSILGFVAHNRKLYPMFLGASGHRGYAGGDKWRDHVRGQPGGVVVDDLQAKPSEHVGPSANHRIRDNLAPAAKFVAARTKDIYPDVEQERAMVLTDNYLFDVFWLKSDKPRRYDWHVKCDGYYSELPKADFTLVTSLADGKLKGRLVKRPLLQDMKVADLDSDPWSVTMTQEVRDAKLLSNPYHKAWHDKGVGVRVHMLGEQGTFLAPSLPAGYKSDAERGAYLLVQREKPETVFVALHEPFAGGPAKAAVREFKRIQQTDSAVAVRIAGQGIDDRVLLSWADGAEAPATLADKKESFTFTGYGYIKVGEKTITAVGEIAAIRMDVGQTVSALILNGKEVSALIKDGALIFPKP